MGNPNAAPKSLDTQNADTKSAGNKSPTRPPVKLPGFAASSSKSIRRPDIHPLDRAIMELRSELARHPDDPTILSRIGALCYRRGDLQEAEKYLRKAIAANPQRSNYHNNLGNVLCDMGRMKEGIEEYEAALTIEKAANPDRTPSPEPATNLELAKTEYRLIHERIEYLQRAIDLDVATAEELNALGGAYLLKGDRELALKFFRSAAQTEPRTVHAGLNIAFTHSLDFNATDMTSAAGEIATFIAAFPGMARLHIHWGELLENAGLLEEAEERYVRAIKSDSRCLHAYELLGRVRDVLGGDVGDESSQAVEKALKELEGGASKTHKKSTGAPLPAEALYDSAVAAVARGHFTRESLRDWKAVDAVLRAAVHEALLPSRAKNAELRTVAARASLLRVQLLERQGKRGEASVVLENMPLENTLTGAIGFERGAVALRCGDIDKALNSFDKATLADPQDAVAYHSLRFAFEGYRRYWTEKVRFEMALKANPKDALAYHHMGMTSLSVLKDDEAVTNFTKALELDHRMADAACGKGRALQRQGHFAQAEKEYQRALQIDPENADARRYLTALAQAKKAK